MFVSIHAPVTDAMVAKLQFDVLVRVSTHAPVTDATFELQRCDAFELFQSTRP